MEIVSARRCRTAPPRSRPHNDISYRKASSPRHRSDCSNRDADKRGSTHTPHLAPDYDHGARAGPRALSHQPLEPLPFPLTERRRKLLNQHNATPDPRPSSAAGFRRFIIIVLIAIHPTVTNATTARRPCYDGCSCCRCSSGSV